MADSNEIPIEEPRKPFDKIRHPRKRAFLRAYAKCGTITHAAKSAGIDRTTHNVWLKDDPDYPAGFAESRSMYCDQLELEADRRAVQGMQRFKFYRGRPIMVPSDLDDLKSPPVPYVEHVYSDALLLAKLAAHIPEKCGRRAEFRRTAKHDVTIKADVVDPDLAERLTRQARELRAARMAAENGT